MAPGYPTEIAKAYVIENEAMIKNKKHLLSLLAFVVVAVSMGCSEQVAKSPVPPGTVSDYEDSPFGMHSAFFRPFLTDNTSFQEATSLFSETKESYRYALDINIRWIRLTSDIYWSTVQPTKEYVDNGIYDWTFFDTLVGQTPPGVNILGTISVGKGRTEEHTWKFINKKVEDEYLQFVKKAVERYDGDGIDDMPGLKNPINHWQIENEPAVFYERKMDWQGFSHLVEITYRTIKENQPEAKIALGGLAGGNVVNNPGDPFHDLLLEQLNDFYFPLLRSLKDKGVRLDVFDIHYYSGDPSKWPNEWEDNWQDMIDIYSVIRRNLDENGYRDTEIWITETATTERINGEEAQAASLVKRYVYPLSFGVKKVFWWNMVEGEFPLEADKPSNHFGLIYDGIGKDDPGYGVKKLSYYTYKKMVEVLEGSDWSNIQTIQEKDGVHIYKFTKQGKSVWVAWNDNQEERSITILGIDSDQVAVTDAVPKYELGEDVSDCNAAFEIEMKTAQNGETTIRLGKTPVYVEEK